MKAPTQLTVILRDDSPFRHFQASPKYRVVKIELTDEQRRQLILNVTDTSGMHGCEGYIEFHEEIDRAILE